MKKSDKEKVTDYLKSGGVTCPHCGSEGIEGSSFDFESPNSLSQEIGCLDCGKEWRDFYTLTSVKLNPNSKEGGASW